MAGIAISLLKSKGVGTKSYERLTMAYVIFATSELNPIRAIRASTIPTFSTILYV